MVGGDEGIDFKEGVRDSEIYGNYMHDLSDKAIYIDGGGGFSIELLMLMIGVILLRQRRPSIATS